MHKKILIFIFCFIGVIRLFPQMLRNDPIMIGAEIFIEPGQNPDDVDEWFKTLKENQMDITRIRMFENYMRKPDGTWDFTLFDRAFEAADKYNVKIYANFFPFTTFDDIGGFFYVF